MKSRLDQLTIEQFITMALGDTSVLLDAGENVSEDLLKKQAAVLTADYRAIVDPAGTKAIISKDGGKGRRRMKIMLLRICAAMLEMGDEDTVRSILADYGWMVERMDSAKIASKCKVEFSRLEAEEKREREKNASKEPQEPVRTDIRASFAKEVAMLMTFYKMSINVREIGADVYANLVRQASEQSKQMRSKVNQKKKS